jgi:hypothetical protein
MSEINTKKNNKRVAGISLYDWLKFPLIYINFNFDFLDLYTTLFLKIISPMNLLDRSFLKQFQTFAVRALSCRPKETRLLLVSLYLIKHCCSCFKVRVNYRELGFLTRNNPRGVTRRKHPEGRRPEGCFLRATLPRDVSR